jgi:hypothetical protein
MHLTSRRSDTVDSRSALSDFTLHLLSNFNTPSLADHLLSEAWLKLTL